MSSLNGFDYELRLLPPRVGRFLLAANSGVECGVKLGIFRSQPLHEFPKGGTFGGKDHAAQCKEKDPLEEGKKESYDAEDN
jgi:hypothetical protein